MKKRQKQDAVVWIRVLARMESMLHTFYLLGMPASVQPTLRLYEEFLNHAQKPVQAPPRYEALERRSLFMNPFTNCRNLARQMGSACGMRVPDEVHMNHRLVEVGMFPVLETDDLESTAKILIDRLVVLARYLAGDRVTDTDRVFADLKAHTRLSPRAQALMSELFWEGIVNGIRPDIERLSANLNLLDRLQSAYPSPFRYVGTNILRAQLRMAEYVVEIRGDHSSSEFLLN